ncbi:hypothetical protein AB205_0018290 [Aquarana catesbeiana]|uniref:Uncharacterized protein n=1 Tax=Aquarana catesbeiana TaxID=8400 RepID=A0A2G9RFB0_AQUCT|nr:hypothetical protein AB205_0018290 [Aquarana catesbeiana]
MTVTTTINSMVYVSPNAFRSFSKSPSGVCEGVNHVSITY